MVPWLGEIPSWSILIRERIDMSDEMQDFKLNASETAETAESARKRPIWPYLIVAVVIVGLLIFFLRPTDQPSPVAEPTTDEAAAVAPEAEDAEEGELQIGRVPGLDQSDGWLRAIVEQLSTHPELAEWLLTDDLIRTFVVVVDNVAEGSPPSNHVKFLAPDESFQVRETADRTMIDPASYQRYNTLIDVVESIDPQGAATLYRGAQPLLQQAYEDLGYPGQSFEVALGRAVQRLLAVPVIEEPIEVDTDIAAYKYHDERLEQLSPVAKQFLRLGPDNLMRLQAKVRELARAAGVPTG